MKHLPNKSIALAVLFLLICFLLIIYMIVYNMRQIQQASKSIQHTSNVLLKTNKILTEAKDHESNSRAFVLTGDVLYLQSFLAAESKLANDLQDLSNLVRSDKSLSHHVNTISALVKEKLNLSLQIVQMRKSSGLDAAIAMIKNGNGKKMMKDLKNSIAQFDNYEKNRLAQERAEFSSAVTIKNYGMTAAIVLLLFLVFLMLRQLVREFKARKQVFKSVAEEREQLSLTLGCIGDGLLTTDVRGRVNLMNRVAEQITGYSKKEAYGQPVSEIFKVNWRDHRFEKISTVEMVMATGKVSPPGNITPILSKTGEEFVVSDSAAPIHGIDGKMIGVVIVFKDETKMFNSMAQLKESEERFQLAAKATKDVIWDWNISTGEMRWSEAYKTAFGYQETYSNNEQEWSGRMHPDDRVRVLESLKRQIASAAFFYWQEEYRYLKADGGVVDILDKGYMVYDDYGNAVRFVGVMRDVTLQNRLKQNLNEEEKKKQKQISDAVISAQEKEKTEIGQELHDHVNQLLVSSKLYMEMAGSDEKNSDSYLKSALKYNKIAIEEVRKLSKTLISPLVQDIDISEAIAQLANDIMQLQPVKIHVNVNDCNEAELNSRFLLTLYRIAQEQMTNIIRHARGKNAWISLTEKNGSIYLQIKDDGIGFDTRAKRKGMGITHILGRVNLYKGQMELSSAPGKGCDLVVGFKIADGFIIDEKVHQLVL